MFVVAVSVWVKPESIEAFKHATLDNARNTRREPGNLRFDVSQGEEEPGRFLLYEVYGNKEDFSKHQQTEHYLRWKQTIAEWMAQPRLGAKFNTLFYGDSAQ